MWKLPACDLHLTIAYYVATLSAAPYPFVCPFRASDFLEIGRL